MSLWEVSGAEIAWEEQRAQAYDVQARSLDKSESNEVDIAPMG